MSRKEDKAENERCIAPFKGLVFKSHYDPNHYYYFEFIPKYFFFFLKKFHKPG
jgi:hypothetical protein